MEKQLSASRTGGGGKGRPAAAQDKKKRLADALRQNLARRKDKKEAAPEKKPDAD
ncbi:MAG: hypothetical protein ACLP7P_10235 [Rhodomicrobium sp.]